MSKADAQIYSGVDSAERRRISRELEKAKIVRDAAFEQADRLRQQAYAGLKPWERPDPKDKARMTALNIAHEIKTAHTLPPTRLLAHGGSNGCHKPTSLCTCTDAEGKPLQW